MSKAVSFLLGLGFGAIGTAWILQPDQQKAIKKDLSHLEKK
jgi:hypothetical protein